MQEVAVKARKFLFEDKFVAMAEKPKTAMNYYIGGYSSGEVSPETWLVSIDGALAQSPDPQCQAAAGIPNICYSGQPDAINRLLMGVGMQHQDALIVAGFDANQANTISQIVTANLQAPVLHPAMPVQDAIDLADFLVETTKKFVRFLPGADTVGGDTDIAVVTKHEGFKWVKRKHYFSKTLNPSEVSYGARFPAEKGKPGQPVAEDS